MHTDKLKIMINQNLAKGKRMKFLILNEMDKKSIVNKNNRYINIEINFIRCILKIKLTINRNLV